MKTITIRGCSPEVMRAIEERAKKGKTSLSRAVIGLLEEALGHDKGRKKVRYHDLDGFLGRWSRSETDHFDAALKSQRRGDPGFIRQS